MKRWEGGIAIDLAVVVVAYTLASFGVAVLVGVITLLTPIYLPLIVSGSIAGGTAGLIVLLWDRKISLAVLGIGITLGVGIPIILINWSHFGGSHFGFLVSRFIPPLLGAGIVKFLVARYPRKQADAPA